MKIVIKNYFFKNSKMTYFLVQTPRSTTICTSQIEVMKMTKGFDPKNCLIKSFRTRKEAERHIEFGRPESPDKTIYIPGINILEIEIGEDIYHVNVTPAEGNKFVIDGIPSTKNRLITEIEAIRKVLDMYASIQFTVKVSQPELIDIYNSHCKVALQRSDPTYIFVADTFDMITHRNIQLCVELPFLRSQY